MTTRNFSHGSCRAFRAIARLVGALCIALLFGRARYADGAGVTVIAHGHTTGTAPAWIYSMRNAIADQVLGSAPGVVYAVITVSRSLAVTVPPLTTETNEVLAVLDWSAAQMRPTTEVAEAIVDEFIGSGYAELPIHLIGHSRGGSLVSEMARLFGEQGIWVDHVTTLDPHPVAPLKDAPVHVYENTLFADNYWRADGDDPLKAAGVFYDFDGESVTGAYNRYLTEFDDSDAADDLGYNEEHSDVHLWYHGTIDLTAQAYDGTEYITWEMRHAWWTDTENEGATAGFYYSRLVGGGRISDGYHDNIELGGSGSRQLVDLTNAVWPNIITFDVRQDGGPLDPGPNTVSVGTLLELDYTCQDYDSPSEVNILLDTDRNPYNGVGDIVYGTDHDAIGDAILGKSVPWDTSNMIPGTEWYLLAAIGDGAHIRYLYARQSVSFVEPPDDNYEPNDTLAEAYDLSGREGTWLHIVDGLGIQADDDWFEILLEPCYNRVQIDCHFTHGDGNIDMALYDSEGTPLTSAETEDDNEFIDYAVPTAGTYYIAVYGDHAGNTYDLRWQSFPPVPVPPTDVAASDGTYTDRIDISWTAVPCADQYQVYRHTTDDPDSATPLEEWQTDTGFSDESALAETVYYYWVKAENDSGTSGFSTPDTGWVESAGGIAITGLSPHVGVPGMHVTIAGRHFEPDVTVEFGDVMATVLSVTETELVVEVPPGSGTVNVRATNPGTGLSAAAEDTFTYGSDPDVDGSEHVDAVDVQLVINAALGLQDDYPCDLDNSGRVDAIDVQLVINAALGIGY